MKDWDALFNQLPSEELDKVALLRIIECSNGVIQYSYRDSQPWALSLEDTRKAMKYSMGCMKTMSIPLKNETIVFAPETQELLKQVREIYISGAKNNVEEDWIEFLRASKANLLAAGKDRIIKAKQIAIEQIDAITEECIEWGFNYILSFVGWSDQGYHYA